MVLKVYTDGGSKSNPGPASIGGVGYLNQKKVFEFKKSIGIATNNDAEYFALIEALEQILSTKSLLRQDFPLRSSSYEGQVGGQAEIRNKSKISNFQMIKKIEFFSDSRLMVNQVNGFFKVKSGKIKEYILKIRVLEQEINLPIFYHLVSREQNREADRLVNSI